MSGEPKMPARLRLVKAAAVVMAILVAVPGVDAVARFVAPSLTLEASGLGVDAGVLLEGGDAFAVLDRVEGALEPDGADVPAWYSDELGLLPGARDVHVGMGGAIVGYVVDGDSPDVLARLSDHMESVGWTAVPLGEVEGATFVKQSGSCTWALVTCTQVGQSTSVVVRCVCA